MIPFNEIDDRLRAIGKNRAWLADSIRRKLDTVESALAPKAAAHKRSASLQGLMSDAIEREEARQAAENSPRTDVEPEIPPGHAAIYLSGEALERAERASRTGPWPSLGAFCRDAIKEKAQEILAWETEQSGNLEALPDPPAAGKKKNGT